MHAPVRRRPHESCSGERCPFCVGCVVEPIRLQLTEQPALAQHLLALRADLDRAGHPADGDADGRLFYHLLNEEQTAE